MASQTRFISSSGPLGQWTDPDNALADDGSCATVAAANRYQDYDFTNDLFSIPSGATINGFEVEIEHSENDDDDVLFVLIKPAGGFSADKVPANNNGGGCGGVVQATLGDPNDLWGESWTVAHINSTSFDVRIESKATGKSGGGWWVDYIKVTVYYTPLTAEAYGYVV